MKSHSVYKLDFSQQLFAKPVLNRKQTNKLALFQRAMIDLWQIQVTMFTNRNI